MSYHAGSPEEPSELVQSISSNIQRLTLLTAELQRLVSQPVTELDSSNLQTLQQKQHQGNTLAKETDRLMKAFTALPVGPDQRKRKIQKERLLNDFSAALNSFQKVQRLAANKEKEFVARVRASSRLSIGPSEDSFGNEPPSPFSEAQVQAQADAITEDDLRLIEERELALRQLEADIIDINDIFKDLGMMVHEQGDMIDSIEAHVEKADVSVQRGMDQLSRASNHQQSSRKKILIIVMVLVVIGVVVGLIIWGALRT